MAHLMHQINQGKRLDEVNFSELNSLSLFVDEKIKKISKQWINLTVNEMAQIGSGKTGNGGDWSASIEPLLWN
ncbi:hypothetical protein SCA6_007274 [Theobroma cacao]